MTTSAAPRSATTPMWRTTGAALGLAALGLLACEDVHGEVPAPSQAMFRAQVYPLLLRDCGFAGCHGDPRRPLFTPGPGRVRLDPATDLLDPPTADELALAHDRARALLLGEGDEPPPLLHKPTRGAAHRGRDPAGRNVYDADDAPALAVLRAWAASGEASP